MEEAVTLASDPAGPRGPVSPLGPFRLARATTLSQFFPSPENWMYPPSTRRSAARLVCRSPAYRPTDARPDVLSTGRAAVLPVNTTS